MDRKLINLVGELLAALRENSKFRSLQNHGKIDIDIGYGIFRH